MRSIGVVGIQMRMLWLIESVSSSLRDSSAKSGYIYRHTPRNDKYNDEFNVLKMWIIIFVCTSAYAAFKINGVRIMMYIKKHRKEMMWIKGVFIHFSASWILQMFVSYEMRKTFSWQWQTFWHFTRPQPNRGIIYLRVSGKRKKAKKTQQMIFLFPIENDLLAPTHLSNWTVIDRTNSQSLNCKVHDNANRPEFPVRNSWPVLNVPFESKEPRTYRAKQTDWNLFVFPLLKGKAAIPSVRLTNWKIENLHIACHFLVSITLKSNRGHLLH